MQNIVKEIFENHQIRKNKQQKNSFIEFVKRIAQDCGYETAVEQGSLGARNIVVGNPETADVIYTAHYDTCAVLPFPNFITPKNISIYLLYQVFMVVTLMYMPVFLLSALSTFVSVLLGADQIVATAVGAAVGMLSLVGAVFLIMAGPANKNTANDNTSGVITLFAIMKNIPEHLHGKTAFVFFDLEEIGLVGSASYRVKHKEKIEKVPVVNFDCVSDGKNFIFVAKKQARAYENIIKEAFLPDGEYDTEVLTGGVIYPSDQSSFPRGIGVAAVKKSKKLGLLYMDRIHTAKDTAFDYNNIDFLCRGAISFSEKISEKNLQNS